MHRGDVCSPKNHAPEYGEDIPYDIPCIPEVVPPNVIVCQVLQCLFVEGTRLEPHRLLPDYKLSATSYPYHARHFPQASWAKEFVIGSGISLVHQPQVGGPALICNAPNYLQAMARCHVALFLKQSPGSPNPVGITYPYLQ